MRRAKFIIYDYTYYAFLDQLQFWKFFKWYNKIFQLKLSVNLFKKHNKRLISLP